MVFMTTRVLICVCGEGGVSWLPGLRNSPKPQPTSVTPRPTPVSVFECRGELWSRKNLERICKMPDSERFSRLHYNTSNICRKKENPKKKTSEIKENPDFPVFSWKPWKTSFHCVPSILWVIKGRHMCTPAWQKGAIRSTTHLNVVIWTLDRTHLDWNILDTSGKALFAAEEHGRTTQIREQCQKVGKPWKPVFMFSMVFMIS